MLILHGAVVTDNSNVTVMTRGNCWYSRCEWCLEAILIMQADCLSSGLIETEIFSVTMWLVLLKAGLWANVNISNSIKCITNCCHFPVTAFWKTSMHSSVVAEAVVVARSPNLHPTVTPLMLKTGGSALHHILKMCFGKISSYYKVCLLSSADHMTGHL